MKPDYSRRPVTLGTVVLCAAAVLSACQDRVPDQGTVQGAEQNPGRLIQPDDTRAIVRRGDAVATLADMEVHLQRMPKHLRGPFLAGPKRVSDALGSILRPRQLAAHARADSAPFLDDPVFNASLEQLVVDKIGDRYMNWRWENEALEDYSAKAEELFLVRPDLFRKPLHVDFTQVLIRAGQGHGELQAVEGIATVFEELRSGKTLGEIVAEPPEDVDLDASSRRFDNVELSSLEETVAEVLEAMEPGDISEPFRSQYGWHIIEFHREQRPETGSYEANRERALELARQRHRTAFHERLLREISNESVEFTDQGLDALRERYPSAAEQLRQLGQELNNGDEEKDGGDAQ